MKKKIALLVVLVMALSFCFSGCGNSDKVTINVLNWGDYIDEELLDQFTEETGIEVNYQTMATNEEMLVKLEASDCIYDVCFPSDYIIEKLIAQDLLHPLNKENIPNLVNIDDRFPGETRDHVLEILREARDIAEKEGRRRRAQLLEAVLVANEPVGELKSRREKLEKIFESNGNIINGPVLEALEKSGISHKEGENYLLAAEILKRNY